MSPRAAPARGVQKRQDSKQIISCSCLQCWGKAPQLVVGPLLLESRCQPVAESSKLFKFGLGPWLHAPFFSSRFFGFHGLQWNGADSPWTWQNESNAQGLGFLWQPQADGQRNRKREKTEASARRQRRWSGGGDGQMWPKTTFLASPLVFLFKYVY